MSFSAQQIADLQAPLNRKHVKSRSQAGRSLSYIEGWHAIAEANRIFGFDGWDRETVELRACGEARQVGDKWRVAFMCRVRIRVGSFGQTIDDYRAVLRDGTGYGSGIDKDLGQAYESAIKEAETDAMKRALMTFGNPFGLALYDKDQANVVDDSRPRRQSDRHIVEDEPEDEAPDHTWSELMAEAMVDSLRKRVGAASVEAFLARADIKRDLGLMEIKDHTYVMGVAAEQRAKEPAAGVA